MAPSHEGPTTHRRRPWSIPPTPTRLRYETVHAAKVLTEFEPPIAVLLWLLLRDIELWAAAPVGSRTYMIRPSVISGRLARQLNTVADAVRELLDVCKGPGDPAASTFDETRAARACARIAAWSAGTAPITALCYSLAAAHLQPRSAPAARQVANHAARSGQDSFAESWYRRAIALARRAGDWASYAGTFAEIGDRALARRDYTLAATAYARAARTCRRHGIRDGIPAQIAVGRFHIALADGDAAARDHHQRVALREGRANRPAIIHALAEGLIGYNHHELAIAVLLLATTTLDTPPIERLTTAQLLARAACRVGDQSALRTAAQLGGEAIAEMPPAQQISLVREFDRDLRPSA